MNGRLRLTFACGIATMLAASAIGPLFSSWRWLGYALGIMIVLTCVSAVARRLFVPAGLVPLVNLVAYALFVSAVFGRGQIIGIFPTRTTLGALHSMLVDASVDIQQLAAPAPPHDDLLLVMVLSLGLVGVVVDAIAVSMRRPALAGLPLLAVYAVPVAIAFDGLGWVPFALGTIGYLVILLSDGRDRVVRWGRPVSARGAEGSWQPDRLESSPLASAGRRIGAAAICAAVIVPLLIPGLTAGGLARVTSGNGLGFGFGTGSHTATVINPITTLRGQLIRSEPIELLRVTPTDPDIYLRVTTLDQYRPNHGWTQSRLTASVRQRVDSGLPAPQIGADVPIERVRTTVQTKALATSQYLPSYPNPTRVDVDGDWRYDPGSGTVFSTRTNTRDLTYTVHAVEPRQGDALTRLLAASPPVEGPLAQTYEQAPADPRIQRVVDHVVGKAVTPYARTLAIYQYFRDPSNGFIYDLQTKPGSTGSDLLDFLQHKQGYCEQYASAMAIMARYAGVPARVAIGYTHGEHKHGYWSITTDDAHAWVEVYFAGIGWTTWDPTPPSGNGRATTATYAPTTAAPSQTTAGGSTATGGSTSTGGVTGTPNGLTAKQQILQQRLIRQDQVFASNDAAHPKPAAKPPPSRHIGWWIVIGLVVLLVLVPGVARPVVSHRRRRQAGDAHPRRAVHAAWDDVLATAYDVGLTLDETETPRTAATRLARQVGLSPDAKDAFLRLATAEERACYARTVDADPALPQMAKTVRRGMLRAADAGDWLRAVVLPRSTVNATSHGIATAVAICLDRLDTAIGRVHRAVLGKLPARSGN